MAIQYVMYTTIHRSYGGETPVDKLWADPLITEVQGGLWMKNGSYIGYIDISDSSKVSASVSKIEQGYGVGSISTTTAMKVLDAWHAEDPLQEKEDDASMIGSINPASVVDGKIVAGVTYYNK